MDTLFSFSCVYLMPIYGIIFGYSLFVLLKKVVQKKENFTTEVVFLTISLILITWSISYTLVI